MELNQKGVSDGDIEHAFRKVDIDWDGLLKYQYQKKYQSQSPETLEEKAKYMRFFLYRGFDRVSINSLFK